jgi:hypothetical protein
MPTTGVAVAAAMCIGPVSPPTKAGSGDQRSELLQIEFSEIDDPPGVAAELFPRDRRDPSRRLAVRRAGAEHQPPPRVGRGDPRRRLREERFRPAPERVPGADVHDDQLVIGADAGRDEPRVHPSIGRSVERHLDRVPLAVRGAAAPARHGGEQVPLVGHRVPRPQIAARGTIRVYIHRRPECRTDPFARAAGPGQPRAARPAVQVERDVEPLAPEPPRQRQVVGDRAAARACAARR